MVHVSASGNSRITQTVRQGLIARLQQSYKKITSHLSEVVDQPHRVWNARYTLESCYSRVEAAIAACTSQKTDIQQSFSELCETFMRKVESESTTTSQLAPQNFCQQYCMLMTCQTVCQCVIGHLVSLREFVEKQRRDTMEKLRDQLLTISGGLTMNGNTNSEMSESVVAAFDQYLAASGQFRIGALLTQAVTPAKAQGILLSDASSFLMMHRESEINSGDNNSE